MTPHSSVFVASLLATVALTSSICAQPVDPLQIQPIPLPSPPVEPVDQAILEAARGILVQASQAFHDAPAVICRTTVVTESLGRTKDLTVESAFGSDGEAAIKSFGSIIVATDGWLNVLDHAIYDRYIRVPLGQGISTGLEGVYGNPFVAGFEVLMREAAPPERLTKFWIQCTSRHPNNNNNNTYPPLPPPPAPRERILDPLFNEERLRISRRDQVRPVL